MATRLIPICAWCKKIKSDEASWEQLEKFFAERGYSFSHGMCPECAEKIFHKRVYLQSYQDICRAISSSVSLDEVLHLIVTNVVKVMNAKASMVRLLSKETGRLEVAASYGLSERYVNKGPVEYNASIERALAGEAVIYDISADAAACYKKEAEEEGIRNILSIPVRFHSEVIGVLRMYTAEPVAYTDEDLKFVSAIAEQAAVAIVNARTFETTISRAREYLRVFQEITKAISSTLDLSEVLNLIVRKVPEVMDLKGATISLLDAVGGYLSLVASSGLSDIYRARMSAEREKAGDEQFYPQPVAIPDISTQPDLQNYEALRKEGIASMLVLPIVARERVIGILRLFGERPRQFTEEEISFSASLAEICGAAIENARLYGQVKAEGLMMLDMLTGRINIESDTEKEGGSA